MTEDLLGRVSPFGYPRVFAPADGSPRLFAVNHVLLRLLMPRHPLCALRSLISFSKKLAFFELSFSYSVVKALRHQFSNQCPSSALACHLMALGFNNPPLPSRPSLKTTSRSLTHKKSPTFAGPTSLALSIPNPILLSLLFLFLSAINSLSSASYLLPNLWR